MPKIEPFEKYTSQYEDWFGQNVYTYQSELSAVRQMIPIEGKGIEIGIGSGLFAVPHGIRYGVEPSGRMIELAVSRGLHIVQGVAEFLPVGSQRFDFALMVTTICFVDDIQKTFLEAWRILKTDGWIIVGFVDKDSVIGKIYQDNKAKSVFYRDATFYSTAEVIESLIQTGFHDFKFNQTVFKRLDQMTEEEPVIDGYGKGSFVVIKARKNQISGK